MDSKTMEQLNLNKLEAEIAKLMAETISINNQNRTHDEHTEKLRAETQKLKMDNLAFEANITKIRAETEKISKDLKWYEVGMIVASTLAVVALVKLFL